MSQSPNRDASARGGRSRVPASEPVPAEPVIGAPLDSESAMRERMRRAEAELKERADQMSGPLRERFEEPVQRVTELTQRTLALFPVRVWRRFLTVNGFLLSAGMSYQALFAIFAAVYVVVAVAGIWFSGRPDVMQAVIDLINTYIPGLIREGGAITPESLEAAATTSTSLFGWTGAVALGGLIWTAIGWVTYSRLAIRSVFGLLKDTRAYVLLKARDFLAALIFGAALLLGAGLTVASTAALEWIMSLFGVPADSWLTSFAGSLVGLVLVFVIDASALIALFRFLSGAELRWRQLWSGSLLGGLGLVVLQLLASTLLGSATRNPLLATFTVFIGLLLWFRFTSVVILVAASWIAERASDRDESLRRVSAEELERERIERERHALLVAARVRVRRAQAAVDAAHWWNAWSARRELRAATTALGELDATNSG
ncbi:YihY/virulence factor BrkB family protein [Agromyces atrinae]|uniref:YihY/virulence factor BrkB family protein n=1 Tax=Agromyces atrinae TaxID=592376 RepID=UPI001F55BCCB|nr:YihY/virulence factor BrkB family protein [Agromyces atrinae]MCI2959621.1 YihY/virulence factor BrkB family protein [Agromyces atrinae]